MYMYVDVFERFFWKIAKLGIFLTPIFFDGFLFSAIKNLIIDSQMKNLRTKVKLKKKYIKIIYGISAINYIIKYIFKLNYINKLHHFLILQISNQHLFL